VSRSLAITGIGLVTPLGYSAAATWDALLRGDAISDHAQALLPDSPPGPRVVALGRHAAAEAVQQSGWGNEELGSPLTALVVATSKGPVEAWLAGDVQLAGLAAVASGVAAGLGLSGGPRLTISAACSSGLQAVIRAAMMLEAGEAQRVLVVGAEASVHPLFISSFRRLGVLPPTGYGCRPFDRERKGFLMSDAAAALCMEITEEPAIARIENFAMGADATHLTGSEPTGVVMRGLLQRVVGKGMTLDVIHAHGTGTIANDAIELNAIESVLEGAPNRPSLYSHKGAIGHSLGAAGLVAIVINCLMHRDGVVPPNARLLKPLATRRVGLESVRRQRAVSRSVALAAGFGGPVAVVSLKSG
jgi:3-oxoacyl-[acyl-carrier-protein] synthase II